MELHRSTQSERIAWRAASIWCATYVLALVAVCFLIIFGAAMLNYEGDMAVNVSSQIFVTLTFLYAIARLFILVEIFRTLCFLPTDAYVAT